MKWICRLLSVLGFTFEYIIPIILFGGVIPYTHDGAKAGLTKMGYIAIGVIFFVFSKKIKEVVLQQDKGLTRALILSAFPIVAWVLISLGLGMITTFVASLTVYWNRVLIFIILGRICHVVEETISDRQEVSDDEQS